MKKESESLAIVERNLAKVTSQKKTKELILEILKVVDTSSMSDAESIAAIRRIATTNPRDTKVP